MTVTVTDRNTAAGTYGTSCAASVKPANLTPTANGVYAVLAGMSINNTGPPSLALTDPFTSSFGNKELIKLRTPTDGASGYYSVQYIWLVKLGASPGAANNFTVTRTPGVVGDDASLYCQVMELPNADYTNSGSNTATAHTAPGSSTVTPNLGSAPAATSACLWVVQAAGQIAAAISPPGAVTEMSENGQGWGDTIGAYYDSASPNQSNAFTVATNLNGMYAVGVEIVEAVAAVGSAPFRPRLPSPAIMRQRRR